MCHGRPWSMSQMPDWLWEPPVLKYINRIVFHMGIKITTNICWEVYAKPITLHRTFQLIPHNIAEKALLYHEETGPESLKPRSSGVWGHPFTQHLTLLGTTKSRGFGLVLSKISKFWKWIIGSTKCFYWVNEEDYHPVTSFLGPILGESEAQW